MAQTSGPQVLGAAAIVGVAVIAAGLLLGNSLDRVTQQLDRTASRLDDIRAAVADAKDALGNLQAAPTATNVPQVSALVFRLVFRPAFRRAFRRAFPARHCQSIPRQACCPLSAEFLPQVGARLAAWARTQAWLLLSAWAWAWA